MDSAARPPTRSSTTSSKYCGNSIKFVACFHSLGRERIHRDALVLFLCEMSRKFILTCSRKHCVCVCVWMYIHTNTLSHNHKHTRTRVYVHILCLYSNRLLCEVYDVRNNMLELVYPFKQVIVQAYVHVHACIPALVSPFLCFCAPLYWIRECDLILLFMCKQMNSKWCACAWEMIFVQYECVCEYTNTDRCTHACNTSLRVNVHAHVYVDRGSSVTVENSFVRELSNM